MNEGKKGNVVGTLLVWSVTALLAVGIVFVAISVSKKKASTEPQISSSRPVISSSPANVIEFPLEEEEVAVEEFAPDMLVVEAKKMTLDDLLNKSYPKQMTFSGARITEGLRYPLEYTCYRNNRSPAMAWDNAPPGTESFALVLVRKMDDGGYFFNWGVYNIGASETSLPGNRPVEKMLDNGVMQARNDHRNLGYTGPCEPKGRFPYSFHLFALDTVLDGTEEMKLQDMIDAMDGHVLDAATINAEHYLRF